MNESVFRKSTSQSKGMSTIFNDVCSSLNLFGLGCHSLRKGSITFASTGTPDTVPWAAVQVRSRWKTSGPDGTIHRRYVKFSSSGDQLVGRILALLPLQKIEFASLPPRFKEEFHIESSIRYVFGDINGSHFSLCRFLLANLIFNYEWMKQNIYKDHPLWKTSFSKSL
jgi:hypothetical protein